MSCWHPSVELIAADAGVVLQAERQTESCEHCHPDDADTLFDWILADVLDTRGPFGFIMTQPARYPGCRGELWEKTMVEPHGGIELETQVSSMYSRIDLPDALAAWIRVHVPTLGDHRKVRFYACRHIPFWWIPGNRHTSGLTLGNRVFLRREYCPIEPANRLAVGLVFHELAHVLQFRRHPVLFPFRYLLHHVRYGYLNNPAEVEARQFAAAQVDQYFRDRDATQLRMRDGYQ
jgi:hypothetical protein